MVFTLEVEVELVVLIYQELLAELEEQVVAELVIQNQILVVVMGL